MAVIRDLETGAIFRDPVGVLDGYRLVGAISNVGVVLWWLAAGICLFTFSLARTLGFARSVRVFLVADPGHR